MSMEKKLLLSIKNLYTGFRIKDEYFNAVDNVSLDIYSNEILAVVGESGCGKSTLATTIMGLHDPNYTKSSGEVLYKGKNLLNLSENEYNKIRGGEIGMIFQDPLSALNPLMRIQDQIAESFLYHTDYDKNTRLEKALELLSKVGIANPKRIGRQYPHQLSGGMRQRVIIAIALACEPEILICDEPTTALDVTIQAQILDLIVELHKDGNDGVVLITHDLGVVAQLADRVAVMYAGQIVELADVKSLFNNPMHPYTRSLLNSIPQKDSEDKDLHVIDGMVPSLKNLPRTGCRFASRIPWVPASEHEEMPELHEVEPGHFVRCTCYKNFNFNDKNAQGVE